MQFSVRAERAGGRGNRLSSPCSVQGQTTREPLYLQPLLLLGSFLGVHEPTQSLYVLERYLSSSLKSPQPFFLSLPTVLPQPSLLKKLSKLFISTSSHFMPSSNPPQSGLRTAHSETALTKSPKTYSLSHRMGMP